MGNADAMAQKSNYRGRDFKIIRNTKDFVPQPGDWGVWTGGWAGHVNIVVGPCTKTIGMVWIKTGIQIMQQEVRRIKSNTLIMMDQVEELNILLTTISSGEIYAGT